MTVPWSNNARLGYSPKEVNVTIDCRATGLALTTALITSINILSRSRTLQDRTNIRGVVRMIVEDVHEVDASYTELFRKGSNV